MGARYTTRMQDKATTLQLALINITDEHYWSTVAPNNITGTNKGNMVSHVGAPRTVSASVSVDF